MNSTNSKKGARLALAGWTAMAGVVAAALAAFSTGEVLRLLGLPDPGKVTTYGLPAVMAVGEMSALVMIGALLLAAVLVPPQSSGVLDVDGYRAVRTAGIAATIWAACALMLVPLSLSDTSGQPLRTVFAEPALFLQAVGDIVATTAWVWTAGLAAVVALGCRLVLRHRTVPALLGVAVVSMMPRALTGHSSAGGSHDIATSSMVLHLVAAGLWVGGLGALVMHVCRGGGHLDVATRRFSALATIAFATMAVSGVVNAAVRLPLADVLTSTYGTLVLGKVLALVVVGVLGWWQRRVAVAALAVDASDRRAFTRLAIAETVVLALTVGLGVALGRTPPPAGERREPSLLEEVLGYGLDGPPTIAAMVTEWRFDLLLGSAALVLAVVYLLGVRRLRRAGQRWPVRRTAGWLLGCLVVLLATSSGVGRYAPAVFSVHLAASAALAVLAPLCLVLAAPLTLAARAFGPTPPGAGPGAREWLRAACTHPVLRVLTHPAVAASALVGTFYLLYIGGLYGALTGSHVLHMLLNGWYLGIGLLFFWAVVGPDPLPRKVGPAARITATVAVLGAYAFFLVSLINADLIVGADYYTSLRRGWFEDLAADQRLGGNLAWAIGELPLLLAAVLTATRWAAHDRMQARRRDDAVETGGDQELADYNVMLRTLR